MKTKGQLIQELYSRYSRGLCPVWLKQQLALIANAPE